LNRLMALPAMVSTVCASWSAGEVATVWRCFRRLMVVPLRPGGEAATRVSLY